MKHSMRILALAVLVSLILTGCSKAAETGLSSDGTISGLEWGMGVEEAQSKLSGATTQERGDALTVIALSTKLGDAECQVELHFRELYGSSGKVLCAQHIFTDSTEAMEKYFDRVFGERVTKETSQAGEEYELTGQSRYWCQGEALSSQLTADDLESLKAKGYITGELDETLDYMLSRSYPVKAVEYTAEDGSTTFEIDGEYAVLLGAVK